MGKHSVKHPDIETFLWILRNFPGHFFQNIFGRLPLLDPSVFSKNACLLHLSPHNQQLTDNFTTRQWYRRTCTYHGGKKCLFFGKFCVLCFLVISVLRFALFKCNLEYSNPPNLLPRYFPLFSYSRDLSEFLKPSLFTFSRSRPEMFCKKSSETFRKIPKKVPVLESLFLIGTWFPSLN